MSKIICPKVSNCATAPVNLSSLMSSLTVSWRNHRDLLVRHRRVMHEAPAPLEFQIQDVESLVSGSPAGRPTSALSGTHGEKRPRVVPDGHSSTKQGTNSSGVNHDQIPAERHNPSSSNQVALQPLDANHQEATQYTYDGTAPNPEAMGGFPIHSSVQKSGPPLRDHDDATSGMSDEGVFSSIWDTQLFEFPWMDNFDLSTSAFASTTHNAQPLWRMPNNSTDPFTQPPENQPPLQQITSDSVAADFGHTLPTPSSPSKSKPPQQTELGASSLFDRIFSRRASPDSQKGLPISPKALRASSRIATKVRNRLKIRLEPISALLPTDFILPSHHALGRYVAGYFDGFHLHLPFIHVPTWSPVSCHPGLLLAMCALGAKYSFEQDMAMSLWKTGRLVVRLATEEREELPPGDQSHGIEICQSMLLLMACQTWTGDQFLLRQALSFQSSLASVRRVASLNVLANC